MRPLCKRKGFSLFELMLVVAILSFLAVLATIRLGRVASDARIVAAKSELKTIREALLSENNGYLRDMASIPGFSLTCLRLGNLFVPTNIFGSKVISSSSLGLETCIIRLDTGGESFQQCETERRAHPSVFTKWNASTRRGWRGPYISSGATGFFPAKDDVRFRGDRTFEERNFFPVLTNLRLPSEFKDSSKASIYGFIGEPTLFDPWGNPYVLQIPPPQAFEAVTNISESIRFSYARVVSAGPDGILSTPCFFPNATNRFESLWSEEAKRISRQAGLIDGTNVTRRGDDLILFLMRSDVDEGIKR
jgi:prepilin-type N-terminal cleavage/methylation domain-containing protein